MTDEPQPPSTPVDYSDRNLTLDADEDRWAWRAKLRRNPATHLVYRSAVGIVGGIVTIGGLIMVPAPGPGWLVVFFGLVILGSEFEFAQRLLHFARRQLGRWNHWVMGQPIWVRGVVLLATVALVWLLFWAYFLMLGVPTLLPDWLEGPLNRLPGVS